LLKPIVMLEVLSKHSLQHQGPLSIVFDSLLSKVKRLYMASLCWSDKKYKTELYIDKAQLIY